MTGLGNQPLAGVRVLAVSAVGSYGGFNTSVQRIRALKSLGCNVHVIDSEIGGIRGIHQFRFRVANRLFRQGLRVPLPDLGRVDEKLIRIIGENSWDVLWLDKALYVSAKVMCAIRNKYPSVRIVGFSPDDMNGRHNQSQQFLDSLSLYHAYITTKSYNVTELMRLGCPRVIFIANGFDPEVFRPVDVQQRDYSRFHADIGFIGTYERERAEALFQLAVNGFTVRVWGGTWNEMPLEHPRLSLGGVPLYGEEFCKACRAVKINLCFLRKLNRDLQTTRSVEIPACGGFMLAERTEEHAEMFVEGQEAEFFGCPEELLEKCKYYIKHDDQRIRIAMGGRNRCIWSDYTNAGRLKLPLLDILGHYH